jgi:glutamate dehydrogenase (NAD(P)+)
VAQFAAEQGATVIAVSDVSGGRHDAGGFDVTSLLAQVEPGSLLKEAAVGDFVTNAELLALDCDVLVPAALENAIDATNVSRVQATLVVEAANHPVTPEADSVLGDRGIIVVPDILANAGGVTGSYFEWTSNLTEFRWPEERFNTELFAFLERAFRLVWEYHLDHGVDLRTGAYMVGIARVAEATRLRGLA